MVQSCVDARDHDYIQNCQCIPFAFFFFFIYFHLYLWENCSNCMFLSIWVLDDGAGSARRLSCSWRYLYLSVYLYLLVYHKIPTPHKRLPLLFFYCSLEVGAHLRHCRCGLRVLQRGLQRWQQCDQETGDQDGGGRQEQPLWEEEVAEEGAIVVDKNTFYGYCGSLKRLRNAMFVLCGEFFGLIWAGVQFNHTTVTSTTW